MATKVCGRVHSLAQISPVLSRALCLRPCTTAAGLPRLPVPPLQQSLGKYLQAVQPLLSESEYAATTKVVRKFADGEGPQLQALLEKRAAAYADSSWLADWWLHAAYLDYRLPVVIHSNPGMMMPLQSFSDDRSWLTHASHVICGALDFKRLIDESALPVDYMGKQPLCMSQYGRIFSTCRIPGIKRDTLTINGGSAGPNAFRHIVVMHNNRFYSVDVMDAGSRRPASEPEVLAQLTSIVERAQREPKTGSPVGLLTAESRDAWGKAYGQLVKVKDNEEVLKRIHNALFVLCLDDAPRSGSDAPADDTLSSAAEQLLHGGHPVTGNSANRWFDKTLQFIVGRNGTVGVNYEHAPAEGPPIAALVDHVLQYKSSQAGTKTSVASLPLPPPVELQFALTSAIKESIKSAVDNHAAAVADVQLKAVRFTDFGSDFVKSQQLSPDAFIQLALQLAYYRMYQKPCSTYETGSTRRFLHGRTDTIRSCTADSVKFTKAMSSSKAAAAEDLANLLRAAVDAHKRYTDAAVSGQAFDRHLLGLKLVAIESGAKIPELYSDCAYSRALHFNLSTSQVSAKSDSMMFFGPVVPDGYGFCYNPRPSHILYGLSAFNSCKDTDAHKLADGVSKSLLDMRDLLLTVNQRKSRL